MGIENTPIIKAAAADGLDSDVLCERVSGEVRRNTPFRLIEWFEHMKCYPSQLRVCDERLFEAVQVDEDLIRKLADLPD